MPKPCARKCCWPATIPMERARPRPGGGLTSARATAIDPQSSAWIGEALLWRGAPPRRRSGIKTKGCGNGHGKPLPHLAQNLDPADWMIGGPAAEIAGVPPNRR